MSVAAGCGRLGYEELPILSADARSDSSYDAAPPEITADVAIAATDAGDLPSEVDAPAPAPDDTLAADAMPERDAPPAVDHCLQLPALRATPVIDGKLDPGLTLQFFKPAGWGGAAPIPADVNAAYAIAWRSDGLYIFVDVTDPDRVASVDPMQLFCADAVELFIDSDGIFPIAPKYDSEGARQFVIGAPLTSDAARAEGAIYERSTPRGLFLSKKYVASPTASGYTVEAFIEAADLNLTTWALAAGQLVGVNLAHDVSFPQARTGSCGTRLGQYFIQIDSTSAEPEPFRNSKAFCSSRLLP